MSRSLRHFLPLEGDAAAAASVFTGDPGRWLPLARRVGADRFTMDVGTDSISRPVTVTVGEPWRVGGTWWRACSWEPIGGSGETTTLSRLLPSLDAELGVSVRDGRATLVLDGRYEPPGGRFGEAVDAVALNRVARLTLERWLAQIGRRLAVGAMACH